MAAAHDITVVSLTRMPSRGMARRSAATYSAFSPPKAASSAFARAAAISSGRQPSLLTLPAAKMPSS